MSLSKSFRNIDGFTPEDLVGGSAIERSMRHDAVVLLNVEGNESIDGGMRVESIGGTKSPPRASSHSKPVSMPLVSIQSRNSNADLDCELNGVAITRGRNSITKSYLQRRRSPAVQLSRAKRATDGDD